VIANGHGACLDATPPALELLGTDLNTLRMLRVGDLTRPDTGNSLIGRLIESCDKIDHWLGGTCELLRPDGGSVRVRFATLRTKDRHLAIRFETVDDPFLQDRVLPRAMLEAWREQEVALAGTPPGGLEHRAAQLEALWLAAEYQRLAIARAEAIDGEQ
jgi:hypothetical protein